MLLIISFIYSILIVFFIGKVLFKMKHVNFQLIVVGVLTGGVSFFLMNLIATFVYSETMDIASAEISSAISLLSIPIALTISFLKILQNQNIIVRNNSLKNERKTGKEILPLNVSLTATERRALKEKIAENRFEEVLDQLKDLIKEEPRLVNIFDELIILKSRLNQIQTAVRKGTLSPQEENLEWNKFRDNLLAIINTIA